MGKEVDPSTVVSLDGSIKQFMLIKDQTEKDHNKIIYYKHQLYLVRHGHIAEIKHKEEKIKKSMKESNINDLLSYYMIFK